MKHHTGFFMPFWKHLLEFLKKSVNYTNFSVVLLIFPRHCGMMLGKNPKKEGKIWDGKN